MKEKNWKRELKEDLTEWKILLKDDLTKEEKETPDQLLKKKIAFGELRSYLNLYEEIFTNNKYYYDIKKELKNTKFYDLVFSIILKNILENNIVRFYQGKISEVAETLEKDKLNVLHNKSFFEFDKKGIANIDFSIAETDNLKNLKNEVNAISIIKVLQLTDKWFNIPAKYNEDSLRRYFNIFDLILLDIDTIDKNLLDINLLDLELKTTCNLIITKER